MEVVRARDVDRLDAFAVQRVLQVVVVDGRHSVGFGERTPLRGVPAHEQRQRAALCASKRWEYGGLGDVAEADHGVANELVVATRHQRFDPDLLFFVRPSALRFLFTVAAAICFARLVLFPDFFSLSLMCSYMRSSFAVPPFGMAHPPRLHCKLRIGVGDETATQPANGRAM